MKRKDVIEGIRKCLIDVEDLLSKTELMLKEKTDNSIALGLYSFAIEEFGKALMLKEYLNENKESYEIRATELFRTVESHDLKFDKAVKSLPSECTHPIFGVEIQIPSPTRQSISVSPKGDKVTVAEGTTGTFMTGFNTPINFETRMSCFYLDWDETKKEWKDKPKIIAGGIKRDIWYFGKEIEKIRNSLPDDS